MQGYLLSLSPCQGSGGISAASSALLLAYLLGLNHRFPIAKHSVSAWIELYIFVLSMQALFIHLRIYILWLYECGKYGRKKTRRSGLRKYADYLHLMTMLRVEPLTPTADPLLAVTTPLASEPPPTTS
jgi:hypothetical protein